MGHPSVPSSKHHRADYIPHATRSIRDRKIQPHSTYIFILANSKKRAHRYHILRRAENPTRLSKASALVRLARSDSFGAMADYSFGGNDEENSELKKLNAEVVRTFTFPSYIHTARPFC